MNAYKCSYAFDTPSYYDFVVEARSWAEAECKIRKALDRGVFNNVECDICWENADNSRVFVSETLKPGEKVYDPVLTKKGLVEK